MQAMNQAEDHEDALKIALAEYSLLMHSRMNSHEGSGRRFGYYSATLSFAAAAIALAFGTIKDPTTARVVAGSIAGTFFTLGLGMFGRLVELKANAILYTRGLNALRAYFATRAPELIPYLVLPLDERFPPFVPKRLSELVSKSLAGTAGLTNGAVFGIAAGLLAGEATDNIAAGIPIGLPAFVLMSLIHLWYHHWRLSKAERNYDLSLSVRTKDSRN